MTRELIHLTFRNWHVLDQSVIEQTLDRAMDNPGVAQRLIIIDDWFAEITYKDGDYTLMQGRTATV